MIINGIKLTSTCKYQSIFYHLHKSFKINHLFNINGLFNINHLFKINYLKHFSDIFVVDKIIQQKIGYTKWELSFPWNKWHWEIRIDDNGTFHGFYIKTNVSIIKESDVQGCAYAMDWNNVNVGHRYYYIVNHELRSFMGQGDEIFDFDKTVKVNTNIAHIKLNGVFFVGQTKPEGRNFYDHNFYVIADQKFIYTLIPGGWGYTNQTANKFNKWLTSARLENPISASDFFNCASFVHTVAGEIWILFGIILLLICCVSAFSFFKITFFKVNNIETKIEKHQLITCDIQEH